MSTRFVIDSASDIPWQYAKKHKVKVVPLRVNYHGKSFKEDENFDLDAYYKLFETEDKFQPKTSQPSPKLFMNAYTELADEGAKDIIVITISSGLSGTYNSARIAANNFSMFQKDVNVYLVDSLNASFPEVFLLEKGLELAKQGIPAKEIQQQLIDHVPNVTTRIYLESLKYLHLGGRINIAKYLLARVLRKQALIRVNKEGKNESFGTVNSIDEGLERLIEDTTNNYTRFPSKVTIVHTNVPENAEKFKKLLSEKLPKIKVRMVRSRTSISAHTGPHGVAMISNFED